MSKQQLDAAGVDYLRLDEFKRRAQQAAMETAGFIRSQDYQEIGWTRGESAYAVRHIDTGFVIGCVIEGLGTKNLVAEDPALRARFGRTFEDAIANCNIAMIFNDLITIGVPPLIYMSHPALAGGDYLEGANGDDHIAGTVTAMRRCGSVWGCGETPELNGIITPGTMCLSGAAVGVALKESLLINPANIRPGHRILLIGSSGIHANGLSKARKIAAALPERYLTAMPSGQTFGEALLTPTIQYAPFVRACLGDRPDLLSYAVNMTGHGWRKIMRAPQPFTYRITRVPKPQEVFSFMQQHGGISNEDAYKAFNMGAGFCLIVNRSRIEWVRAMAAGYNMEVTDAGVVEEGPRQVIIEPHKLVFDELSIR